MSEASNANQNEKATKVRRKPERESPLSPTFAAARQTDRNAQHQAHSSGGALLQRQCSCGKHTIGGGLCEECQQKGEGASQVASDEHGEAISPDIQTSRDRSAGFDFSSIPAHTLFTSSHQIVQPNLMVNEPGDQYEQEADRVAEAVMRMPVSSLPPPLNGIGSFFNPTVSRLPSISRIQTSGGSGAFQAPSGVEARINQMQGGGQPLPETERDFFEQRMGYDFSGVRVHTDSNAVQASRDIQAQAFTMGPDIAFNEGAYRPGTNEGRHLLAHELTHVVQQSAAGLQRKPVLSGLAAKNHASQVLTHLKTLQQQPDFDASIYRKEIAQFQHKHPVDNIIAKQEHILDLQAGVDIRERDTSNSQTLRRCGGCSGSGCTPGGGGSPGSVTMDKVVSGSFQGGKSMGDYFPDLAGKGYWAHGNTGGPFDTGTRVGANAQLVGTIPAGDDSTKYTLEQTVKYDKAVFDGTHHPREGKTVDDIAKSGRDQSKSPFRQTWSNKVSMADPPSVDYSSITTADFDRSFVTSLSGPSGRASVNWSTSIRIRAGSVTKNTAS